MTTKYRCKLCDDEDYFVSENFQEVGMHIVEDHTQREINDFVTSHGTGIQVVKEEI